MERFVRFAKSWRNLIIIPWFHYSFRYFSVYKYVIYLKRKQQYFFSLKYVEFSDWKSLMWRKPLPKLIVQYFSLWWTCSSWTNLPKVVCTNQKWWFWLGRRRTSRAAEKFWRCRIEGHTWRWSMPNARRTCIRIGDETWIHYNKHERIKLYLYSGLIDINRKAKH